MTYSELKNLIQNYLENSETTFVNDLPQIIKQAEDGIRDTTESRGLGDVYKRQEFHLW